ncbi:hypothetical protein [Dyadobacter arcticus]|uniref:Uncharacterized protein n=1 Tax=Dyadobacter arcticus TaxID=1078754 RepID=A0ABX0UFU4_9BACT|nr:hypothetical protein [Dyadobacter arcticus]NIJ51874.1 hypothetical protein [Dyadobacter arcticus]
MKIGNIAIFIILTIFPAACMEISHPAIDTFYLKGKDLKVLNQEAVPKLYEHYTNSKKDKEVYEVISKFGRFILNFTPSLKLLTLCSDAGSGWSAQFKDVDEATLKKLVDYGFSFEEVDAMGRSTGQSDTLLIRNQPTFLVKTNGTP